MPEESGTWNGRGQIKPAGLPGRSRRQRGRLWGHDRGRGFVECSSSQLGSGMVNLSLFCLLQAKESFFLIFFLLKPTF